MEASLAEKQQYLRVEILEAGYDPEDFIEFMNNHEDVESSMIENLSLGQLQKVVENYKKEVFTKQNNLEIPHEEQNETIDDGERQRIKGSSNTKSGKKIFAPERIKLLEEKKNKIEYVNYKLTQDKYGTFDYEMKGTAKCIDSESLVKEEIIELSVLDMETKEIEGYLFGIGAKTEYYYILKTNLMKGSVKRLSEDFDWLNNTLLRIYPTILMPELEPVRKDIKDPYIERKKEVEEYLQHLCEIKFLRHSYAFIDFLTLSYEKMEKYKRTYDSMLFNKSVSALKSQEGYVEVEISNSSREFFSVTKEFSKKTTQLHDSITVALTKMEESYRQSIIDTYAVVDLFASLHDVYVEITNKFPTLNKSEYNDTLVNLNNLFLGIGDNLKNMTDTIEKHTKDYYRFYKGLDSNLFKLQKVVKDSEQDYLEFKIQLQKKKERVISDPTKWDIDPKEIDPKRMSKDELLKIILPKEMLTESELKSWYGYNLKNYEKEFNEYLKMITKRYQKEYKKMAIGLLSDDKKYLEAITKFISDSRRTEE